MRRAAERSLRGFHRRPWVVPLAGVIAVTGVLVARQPLTSPWWVYADSDAPYVASGLNLMSGESTRYFDHPGLPLQQLIALTFRVRLALHEAAGGSRSAPRYADQVMLQLDSARPYYRTFGIVVFVTGTLLAFVLLTRLFGHWSYGAAGSLLWLGAPGLLPMSIQYRADPLLALL